MPVNDIRPVLITGGAGFVGSHIADRFVAEGFPTIVVDDLSTGTPENVSPSAQFHKQSVLDSATPRLVEVARPQLIVHCAAQISVPLSMARPFEDLEINLLATARLADAARIAGVDRFVFLSSGGAIYGETPEPASEDTTPHPQSYYGVHKLAAEYHVALSGIPYSILRPSNIFGPRQRADQEGGVVSIFTRSVRDRGAITIFGDGEQSRDFVHVSDVVEAVLSTCWNNKSGIWNVGTGVATSINELTRLVEEISGVKMERRLLTARTGDVFRSCLDTTRLQRDTGWTSQISLRAGLSDLLAEIE